MAKNNWNDLSVGDFFTTKSYDGDDYALYQKIERHSYPYNAVHINTGKVCCIQESESNLFERVVATFNVKPTE